jgi:hypothetical protein
MSNRFWQQRDARQKDLLMKSAVQLAVHGLRQGDAPAFAYFAQAAKFDPFDRDAIERLKRRHGVMAEEYVEWETKYNALPDEEKQKALDNLIY